MKTPANNSTDQLWRRCVHAAGHAVFLDGMNVPPTQLALPGDTDCPVIADLRERVEVLGRPNRAIELVVGLAAAGVAAELLLADAYCDASAPCAARADHLFCVSLVGEGALLRRVAKITGTILRHRRRVLLGIAGALMAHGSLSACQVGEMMRLDRERPDPQIYRPKA